MYTAIIIGSAGSPFFYETDIFIKNLPLIAYSFFKLLPPFQTECHKLNICWNAFVHNGSIQME